MKGQVYSPSLVFEQTLAMLVALLAELGIKFDGISSEEAKKLLDAEIAEKAADVAAEGKLILVREGYIRRRLARFQKFMEMLETLRGRYRNDPVVSKRLRTLKAHAGVKTKKQDEKRVETATRIRPASQVG